jgi:hypothetical protein
MVIDLGEADVLVGQEAQLLDSGLDARSTGGDAFEKMAQLLLVDLRAPSGMRGNYSSAARPIGLRRGRYA